MGGAFLTASGFYSFLAGHDDPTPLRMITLHNMVGAVLVLLLLPMWLDHIRAGGSAAIQWAVRLAVWPGAVVSTIAIGPSMLRELHFVGLALVAVVLGWLWRIKPAAGRPTGDWVTPAWGGVGCGCAAFVLVFLASRASPVAETAASHVATEGVSRLCGAAGCHPNIVRQWESSPHRHSGNWSYRRALNELSGTRGSGRVGNPDKIGESVTSPSFLRKQESSLDAPRRWRGGHDEGVASPILVSSQRLAACMACHDPLTSRSGGEARVTSDTVQEGISCVICHRMEGVGAKVGGGRFALRPPTFYVGEPLNAYTAHVEQERHRGDFTTDSKEAGGRMCGVCHQWDSREAFGPHAGGIVTFDGWMDSFRTERDGGGGIQTEDCVHCHMPRNEEPDRPGRKEASHRFAASNVDLARAIGDEIQVARIKSFRSAGKGHEWNR